MYHCPKCGGDLPIDGERPYFATLPEDTCRACGCDIIQTSALCAGGCDTVITNGVEHVCAGKRPLYGTGEWDRLDPRTVAAFAAHKWTKPLRECQAFRWPACDIPAGDAIVWSCGILSYWAVIRVGDFVQVIDHVCFNDACKRVGIDPSLFGHPTVLGPPDVRAA
jgi:hypothetical protein